MVGTHTVNTTDRLAALRALMNERTVDAYVVPSEDQHSSEYLASCDERRAFISGFDGSAGTAIVMKDSAYLFTDGRYFLQADQQLDKNWTLMKQGLPDVPTWQEFISTKIPKPSTVGIDPELLAQADVRTFASTPHTFSYDSPGSNLIDAVWGPARPSRPANPLLALDVKYAGEPHTAKLARVRTELAKAGHAALVVSMLDEVAWLFNLRGTDIAFNPVFFAYAIVTPSRALLFLRPDQVTDDVKRHLGDGVDVWPYDAFYGFLSDELARDTPKDQKIFVGERASHAVVKALGGEDRIALARSPVADLKAVKNDAEIAGFRACHVRDGAALARFFAWLEERLASSTDEPITESQAADQLERYRAELDLFKGLSFPTISAAGPNGAVIHYDPDPKDCAVVKREEMYLCDSGAQFLDGTTDVTRTWHFGEPTDEQRRAFTRVLQGHIAIDTAVFPNGTTGYIIDTWARRALWSDGLDYRHGTGHGVGHYLNVHEGPQGLGTRIGCNAAPLRAGMTLSNEPGFYADGRWGIRIESVVVVREAETRNNFGGKGYLRMERLTMSPIQRTLVDASLLAPAERAWLDDYHAEVLRKVSPLLENDPRAKAWLERECAPL